MGHDGRRLAPTPFVQGTECPLIQIDRLDQVPHPPLIGIGDLKRGVELRHRVSERIAHIEMRHIPITERQHSCMVGLPLLRGESGRGAYPLPEVIFGRFRDIAGRGPRPVGVSLREPKTLHQAIVASFRCPSTVEAQNSLWSLMPFQAAVNARK